MCTRSEKLSWAEALIAQYSTPRRTGAPESSAAPPETGARRIDHSFLCALARGAVRSRPPSVVSEERRRKEVLTQPTGRNRRTRARTLAAGRFYSRIFCLSIVSSTEFCPFFPHPHRSPPSLSLSLARDYPSGDCRRIEQHGRQEGRAILHAAAEARKMGRLPGLPLELRDGTVPRADWRQLG